MCSVGMCADGAHLKECGHACSTESEASELPLYSCTTDVDKLQQNIPSVMMLSPLPIARQHS